MRRMRRPFLLLWFLSVVCLTFIQTATAFSNNKPGSISDPAITKSYLEKMFAQIFQEKREQISDLERQFKQIAGSVELLKTRIAPFPDIKGHWAEENITSLYFQGIVGGFSDGQFHPDATVSREQVAVMLVRAKGLPKVDLNLVENPFRDLSPTHWAYQDILTAKEAGMIGGYPDGTFKPQQEMNRAEIATIINRTFILEEKRQSMQFKDVDPARWQWALEHIDALVKAGIISGYGDRTYRPDKSASRAEVATFIFRGLQFDFK